MGRFLFAPLQWGHGFSAVERSALQLMKSQRNASFNGATAFQPWKVFLFVPPQLTSTVASMGPRLFSRGKSSLLEKFDIIDRMLQWGHGFSAVESLEPMPWWLWYRARFNGATAFQPWKADVFFSLSNGLRRFNGATAFQPWKAALCRRSSAITSALQWGHGFSAVES